MQYSEHFVKDIINNYPSWDYYCCDLYECYIKHIDHVLTFTYISTVDGNIKEYRQFLTYKDIFNIYVEYSLIYHALPYPCSDIYYHLSEVL